MQADTYGGEIKEKSCYSQKSMIMFTYEFGKFMENNNMFIELIHV